MDKEGAEWTRKGSFGVISENGYKRGGREGGGGQDWMGRRKGVPGRLVRDGGQRSLPTHVFEERVLSVKVQTYRTIWTNFLSDRWKCCRIITKRTSDLPLEALLCYIDKLGQGPGRGPNIVNNLVTNLLIDLQKFKGIVKSLLLLKIF